jgi:hypothetical protein
MFLDTRQKERSHLHELWALGRITREQMLRCMALDLELGSTSPKGEFCHGKNCGICETCINTGRGKT